MCIRHKLTFELQLWPSTYPENQKNVYINVYQTGKCTMSSTPDVDVTEELADIATRLLYEAYKNNQPYENTQLVNAAESDGYGGGGGGGGVSMLGKRPRA